MYLKLIIRSVRRSARDYLIYIVTMTVCAMLFYAFLSISSRYYHPDTGAEYNFTVLNDSMKLAICSITLLLLFLIRFVNSYMLRSRQKEFAIQSVLGMEQKTIAWIFFAETFVSGAVCVFAGIFLGMFCSQFITAMLLSEYGLKYRLSWMLFPDTALLTAGFFTASLLTAGLFNVRTIRRIKIIDMLCADRLNECPLPKSRYMSVCTAFHGVILFFMICTGISNRYFYYDPRLPLPARIMFTGNIIAPLLALLLPLVRIIWSKKREFRKLVFPELICTFVNICFCAGVPRICNRYQLSFGSSALGSDTGMNQYLLFLLLNLVYLICGIIYLAGDFICLWKEKNPENTYRDGNLFFFGQILSRLTVTAKTMTLICLTLVLSIFLFLAVPALTGWASGYLELRSLYDVQISTTYNNVGQESDLPTGGLPAEHFSESSPAADDYELVSDFLEKHGIETDYDCIFNLYLPRREEFHNRVKWEFPVVAISLSDYNLLRRMLGYDPVFLEENEFTTQWQSVAASQERDTFLKEHASVTTDAGILAATEAYHEDAMGETLYNLYTDVIYIFPDAVCAKLLPVMRNRYIRTSAAISYEDALQLESVFAEKYPEEPEGGDGVNYYIRTRTNQHNSTKAAIFITNAAMTYSGIVLMVICLTVLSLQQLLDASKYRYRFGVLRKMGMEETEIEKLILKQLSIWFGLPVVIAVLTAAVLIVYFFMTVSRQISAYMGFEALLSQVAVTAGILAVLLACYFLSTWILFKRSVGEQL